MTHGWICDWFQIVKTSEFKIGFLICLSNYTRWYRPLRHGFEDDPRNVADGSGGHYFDSLHKQHHALYDLGWERGVMAELARRGGLAEWQWRYDDDAEAFRGARVRCVRVLSTGD